MNFQIIQNEEPIYILGGWQEPDEKWVYTDKAGHTHRWENDQLPSLKHFSAITEFIDCDCCGGYDCEIEPEYYLCKECSERVEPKYRINRGPKYRMGKIEYYVDDKYVSKEEFDKLVKKECIINGNAYLNVSGEFLYQEDIGGNYDKKKSRSEDSSYITNA